MRKYLICITFGLLSFSCKEKSVSKNELFDQDLNKSLYKKLNSEFKIHFSLNNLNSVLNGVKIEELKKGKEIEKEMLFENFKCDCYDKIKISYSQSENRFILFIYEEAFVEDLDWCPESSYYYSFDVKNNKIIDLRMDFIAG
ncbi:hypothetical protein [Flavobacterium sp.]|jgi:hypothetical protein|uniref:hypothetical protein n=1 Tax=Flavobacterium sp. TaxID=239 RepID=UPI002A835265|nr:hypothetical protein [Flavobacterium sp.]